MATNLETVSVSVSVNPDKNLTSIQMDFTNSGNGSGDFFAAPFPSEHRRKPDGRIELSDFPNPERLPFIQGVLDALVREADGYSTTSAVHFRFTGCVDLQNLPTLHQSVADSASVYLLSVDAGAPDFLRRYPVEVLFETDGGPFGGPHLLSVLPLQGIPLRPRTLYAAVVQRNLCDAHGRPLDVPESLRTLCAGKCPEGMSQAAFESYVRALTELRASGTDVNELAGLAVFCTGEPAFAMGKVRRDALSRPIPLPTQPFRLVEHFDDYCVLQTTIRMPVYQSGQPPFEDVGGGWVFDETGCPVLQGEEEADVIVTVPRGPMPAHGFPTAVFIRTGGGGERPLVDRGMRTECGGPAIEPGSGPAREFCRAGFAGVSIDGPHGGRRNVLKMDEQLLMFNAGNPVAMRDNVRQSAFEIVLLAHVLEYVTIDPDLCPGVSTPDGGPVRFDTRTLALMGHSMGATIAPLVLAHEPKYRAAVLSGAGASWISNVIHKENPVAIRQLIEMYLGYDELGRPLHQHDLALNAFQWALESADPAVYCRYIIREPVEGTPRHILMLQGIVDTYILPPIANAASLSLGLDLAGASLDAVHPRLTQFTPLSNVLELVSARTITLPVHSNVATPDGKAVTAVVVQHYGDEVEDGHEVVFQTDVPKYQYRVFLETFLAGTPRVPAPEPALQRTSPLSTSTSTSTALEADTEEAAVS